MTVGSALLVLLVALAMGEGTPDATASPPAPPMTAAPLREIGHVRATSTFCTAFERHFNAAARPMLASDERIGAIGFTLGTIEAHYRARGAELLIYDDRVHLMAFVSDLQKAIPQARRELDDLRASASLARDPESAAQTREIVSTLGKALDTQRQIAIDSLGVVQAMMDANFGTNDNAIVKRVVRDERSPLTIDPLAHLEKIRDAGGPRSSTEVQSQVPGGYDPYTASTPANARDVRSYFQFARQSDRIGEAEAAGAAIADSIAERCR